MGAEMNQGQILGPNGGNPGCERGEACLWDGVHGPSDSLNGACLPGNYNSVTEYNVGAACQRDEDCYSPYGLGRCLFGEDNRLGDRVGSGICAVMGCAILRDGRVGLRVGDGAVPAMVDICRGSMMGNNDICVGFTETLSFCVSGCSSAADCPSGYACPNLGSSTRPLRICWPQCFVDSDCRTGTRCMSERGGSCRGPEDECYCTDAMPRPDAGVRDGGADGGRDGGADGGVDASGPDAGPDATMPDAGADAQSHSDATDGSMHDGG
ncbi:MAG: hypothetical protein NZM37_12965 [Sandaracinaceae bacterium]|nr:hypothetical protein [Sandaracinaceae bacterium]